MDGKPFQGGTGGDVRFISARAASSRLRGQLIGIAEGEKRPSM